MLNFARITYCSSSTYSINYLCSIQYFLYLIMNFRLTHLRLCALDVVPFAHYWSNYNGNLEAHEGLPTRQRHRHHSVDHPMQRSSSLPLPRQLRKCQCKLRHYQSFSRFEHVHCSYQNTGRNGNNRKGVFFVADHNMDCKVRNNVSTVFAGDYVTISEEREDDCKEDDRVVEDDFAKWNIQIMPLL